jgi:long-chain acyl-CoA synthetase
MGDATTEIAAGLITLGVEAGDRVCILGNTRPEWSLCDLGVASAGAVSVPIYPSNSPEECEWVAGNSEAKAVVRSARSSRCRGTCPPSRASS